MPQKRLCHPLIPAFCVLLVTGLAVTPARADFRYIEDTPAITTPRIGSAQRWTGNGYAVPPTPYTYGQAPMGTYGQSMSQPIYPSYTPQTQGQAAPTYSAPSGAFVSPPQLQADYLSPEQKAMKKKPQIEKRFGEIMDWSEKMAGAKTYQDEAKSQGVYPRRTMLSSRDKEEASTPRY